MTNVSPNSTVNKEKPKIYKQKVKIPDRMKYNYKGKDMFGILDDMFDKKAA